MPAISSFVGNALGPKKINVNTLNMSQLNQQDGILRFREGDQPLPTEGQKNVGEAVKADLDKRIALGIQRYGKPLQTFNGRDALQDAYEEALDLVHYLKQAIMERNVGGC